MTGMGVPDSSEDLGMTVGVVDLVINGPEMGTRSYGVDCPRDRGML